MNATPAAVVSASAAVFKDYGIPVATVDEPEGKLLSVPMSLAEALSRSSSEARAP